MMSTVDELGQDLRHHKVMLSGVDLHYVTAGDEGPSRWCSSTVSRGVGSSGARSSHDLRASFGSSRLISEARGAAASRMVGSTRNDVRRRRRAS